MSMREVGRQEFLEELRDRAQAIATGWGSKTAEEQILVLFEEVGELSRALIKRKQGIRQATDWDAEVAKEACDVIISLMAIVGLEDIDFYPILMANLERVEARQRDHLADPTDESGWEKVPERLREVYETSQVVDPWPGESYEGTSLMSGISAIGSPGDLHPIEVDPKMEPGTVKVAPNMLGLTALAHTEVAKQIDLAKAGVRANDLIVNYGVEDGDVDPDWWFECRVCGVDAGYASQLAMLREAARHDSSDCAEELA